MKQEQAIIEELKRIGGLEVRAVDASAAEFEAAGIGVDVQTNSTLFAVCENGKTNVFAINGTDENARVTASLAREIALNIIKRHAVSDPVRAFLDGSADMPTGIRVGKYDYYVFALYGKASGSAVREYLVTMADSNDFVADMSDDITAFCKYIATDDDYTSAGEFAAVLKENIGEEIKTDIKIGVGGIAHGTNELPMCFNQARSALVNGAEFDPQSSVYSYKEYALVKILSGMSASVIENYIKTVLDKNYRAVLNDLELMSAADAFIKYSLNISEASRSMYVHRNTLIYRLDKIEKLTGLNIRNFNDAMSFRVACLLYKMI